MYIYVPLCMCDILCSQNYHYLYKANEISNGGSFYLQSKVVRSKEALDKLYTKQQIEDGKQLTRY